MNGATAEPSVSTTRIPSTSSVSAIGKSQYRFRRARKRTNSRTVAALDTPSGRVAPPGFVVQRVSGVVHARIAS